MAHSDEIPLIIIPDRDDPGCADVFIEGTVDGHHYRFILDTGAGRTHLVADDVTAALASRGSQESVGVLARSSEQLVRIPDVTVGPMRRIELDAIRHSKDHPAPRNLLGMDVIGSYPCHFRFSDAVLAIGKRARSANGMDLNADAAGHPRVAVRFSDAVVSAVWDSGAGITVVDGGFVAQHPQHFEGATPSWGTDATGAHVETPTFIMSDVTIGGTLFAPHRVAAVDLSEASAKTDAPLELILGFTTLCQADWYFDFPGRWWEITEVR